MNPLIQVINYRTSEQPVHELSEGENQKLIFAFLSNSSDFFRSLKTASHPFVVETKNRVSY
jgi:hypothetical protein